MSAGWKKAPAELVARFDEAMAAVGGLDRRQMFGYPAAFANGHFVTGLHQDHWIVRLSESDLGALAARGGTPFEPMPGKPMRGYLALPSDLQRDADELRGWLARALEHALQLPPKTRR